MKAKFSPLKILDFKLLNSVFRFNPIASEETDIDDLFSQYDADIDFAFQDNDFGFIQLMVKISVNRGKSALDGYQLFAEGVGVFEIENESEIDEKIAGNLKYYSSLNMMINNLRNIIYQQSTLGPLGPYLLPPVDVMDLHRQKGKKLKKKD